MKISAVAGITLVIGMLTSNAFASNISVVASSTGCFVSSPAVCVGTPTATTAGVTFTGVSPISGVTDFSPKIGSFDLALDTATYNNLYFDLFVTFTSPDGAQVGDYTAKLSGQINSKHKGAATITFDETTVTPTFSGDDGAGTLTVTLDQESYTMNAAANGNHLHADVYAQISADVTPVIPVTTTPEPGTLVLLGAGSALVLLSRLKTSRSKRS